MVSLLKEPKWYWIIKTGGNNWRHIPIHKATLILSRSTQGTISVRVNNLCSYSFWVQIVLRQMIQYFWRCQLFIQNKECNTSGSFGMLVYKMEKKNNSIFIISFDLTNKGFFSFYLCSLLLFPFSSISLFIKRYILCLCLYGLLPSSRACIVRQKMTASTDM